MKTIQATIDRNEPNPYVIGKAARIIRAGGLVAFPTETVYGLGADALNAEAVMKIYAAKGRPSDNPLILHVSGVSQAASLVEMNDTARKLAFKFWPGPLTLVLPAKPIIPPITRGGLITAAVRMPNNTPALELIHASRTPLAAPSANISGRPSPTDAESVFHDMAGKIDMILDAGTTGIGIESTVIDVTNPFRVLLLRPGGLPREVIEDAIGMRLEAPDSDGARRSPGTRYRHYSPSIPVMIWRKGDKFPGDETCAYMGVDEPDGLCCGGKIMFTSYEDYARGLFAGFRKFEADGFSRVIVQWPENDSGICGGLRDRIKRSASE